MPELQLNSKQASIGYQIGAGKREIFLFGSIGTSKTFGACVALISLCLQYNKVRCVVGRRHFTELKKGTYYSFIEALDKMNVFSYQTNLQDMSITFLNGSQILFVELDHTKDRNFYKIKSINALAGMVDEVDSISKEGYMALYSRTGRQDIKGAPSFIISTMNPASNWVKDYFYNPYRKDELSKDMGVIEFNPEDSFLGPEYYARFDGMPLNWRKRYIYNDFDYEDDIDSLFKYRHFDACLTDKLDKDDTRYVGYDVARSGTDRSVVALWYGKTLVDIQVVKDKEEQLGTDEQAMWLIKYITQNAVLPQHTDVDAVGIGVGVVDHMKSKGLSVKEFVSGSRPSSDEYDMLRSEVIYHFAQGLEKGEIKIYEGCPYRNELISEAMAHNHKVGDKKLAVESKDDVKKRTGSLSPDIFDAVVMGLHQQVVTKKHSRVIF